MTQLDQMGPHRQNKTHNQKKTWCEDVWNRTTRNPNYANYQEKRTKSHVHCSACHQSRNTLFNQRKHKRIPARALGALWILREEIELCGSKRAKMDNNGAVAEETAMRVKEAGRGSRMFLDLLPVIFFIPTVSCTFLLPLDIHQLFTPDLDVDKAAPTTPKLRITKLYEMFNFSTVLKLHPLLLRFSFRRFLIILNFSASSSLSYDALFLLTSPPSTPLFSESCLLFVTSFLHMFLHFPSFFFPSSRHLSHQLSLFPFLLTAYTLT